MYGRLARRAFLAGAAGAVVAAVLPSAARTAPNIPVGGEGGLKDIAAQRGLLYGTFVKAAHFASSPAEVQALGLPSGRFFFPNNAVYAETIARECNIVVDDGGDIVWGLVAPSPEKTSFKTADFAYGWARARGIKYRAHSLVSHENVPPWFMALPDRAAAVKALQDHIRQMCSHFAGNVESWTVVNEGIRPEDGRSDGLRRQYFVEKIGPEYLDIAFHAARDADPHALLVYNDHQLEYDLPAQDRGRQCLLDLIDGFKKRNTPIDAIGIESHLQIANNARLNDRVLSDFIRAIADRGLKIMITELDIVDKGAPSDISARDAEVAALYKHYLDVVLSNRSTIAVINWGLSDGDTWIGCEAGDVCYINPATRRDDGLLPRPLPFDVNYQRKPAYYAIAQALKAAPQR